MTESSTNLEATGHTDEERTNLETGRARVMSGPNEPGALLGNRTLPATVWPADPTR